MRIYLRENTLLLAGSIDEQWICELSPEGIPSLFRNGVDDGSFSPAAIAFFLGDVSEKEVEAVVTTLKLLKFAKCPVAEVRESKFKRLHKRFLNAWGL